MSEGEEMTSHVIKKKINNVDITWRVLVAGTNYLVLVPWRPVPPSSRTTKLFPLVNEYHLFCGFLLELVQRHLLAYYNIWTAHPGMHIHSRRIGWTKRNLFHLWNIYFVPSKQSRTLWGLACYPLLLVIHHHGSIMLFSLKSCLASSVLITPQIDVVAHITITTAVLSPAVTACCIVQWDWACPKLKELLCGLLAEICAFSLRRSE